jgi:hypothetical protein
MVSTGVYQSKAGGLAATDAIPQFDDGDAISGLAIDFAARFASSNLIFRLVHNSSPSNAQALGAAFVIVDGAGSAILTSGGNMQIAGNIESYTGAVELPALDTVSKNYTVRFGINVGTIYLNGGTATRFWGGTMRASLEITEIAT